MSQSPAPRWLIGATAVLLFAAAIGYAFYTVFSCPLSLDEGFLMITVQSFLEGQPLYDSLFTQYGPVYYWYEWIIHRGLVIALTHDATRFLCILHWLAAALTLGIAGGVMTRSAFAGLFVFAQAVVHLAALANEPGHPQELVAVLLALALLVGASARSSLIPGFQLATLALLGTLLLFIKINIGIFFFLSLFLVMYWHGPHRRRAALSSLLIAACAIVPFLLMRRFIVYDWCRNYALLVAAASIAASIAAKYRVTNEESRLENAETLHFALNPLTLWLIVAAAAGITACVAFVFTGTSLRGLIDGVLLTPLRLADAALWPFNIPTFALLSAAGSIVLAAFLAVNPTHPRRAHTVTLLKALFGIAGSIILIGESHAQFKYLLPWIWLVLEPGQPCPPPTLHSSIFARTFLVFVAVWQSLQAYPIAGTQVAMATLLLPVASTICLVDALRAIGAPELIRSRLAAARPGAIRLGQSIGAAALVCLFAFVWCDLPATRRHHASSAVLDLPGSRLVRADVHTVQSYRALADYLEANSDTFLMSPGINSFYFWARKRPPAHLNVTTFSILTAEQEERLLAALNRAQRPLIVVVEGTLTAVGRDNRPVIVASETTTTAAKASGPDTGPLRPFRRALRDEYVEIHRIPPFRIYALKKN